MEICTCANCGIEYHVPGPWYRNRREDHGTFWCPNGHTNYYPEQSKAEKLANSLSAEKRRTTLLSDRLDVCSLSRRALKGQVTKLRNKLDTR